MERRVISMDRDPRREQFQLFSGYTFPYAGVTVQLDVTALELRLRAEHKPVFLTMLYVIHRAVNRVPELRRRIEDGQVVEYDECPVSFTERSQTAAMHTAVWRRPVSPTKTISPWAASSRRRPGRAAPLKRTGRQKAPASLPRACRG